MQDASIKDTVTNPVFTKPVLGQWSRGRHLHVPMCRGAATKIEVNKYNSPRGAWRVEIAVVLRRARLPRPD